MTDKQIILNGVDVLKEKINICFILLLNKLETSETIEQTIYEHLDVFVEEWNKQLKAKEQRIVELNKTIQAKADSNLKLRQTLTEIKSILELYANSKVGEEQSDGTYKLSSGIWDSFGFCTTTYDPRPARQALQKISEVEVC